jgi:nitrile hydratase
MNGAHDLGGRMGFGPIERQADEPVFHAPWEARMFALSIALAQFNGWSMDEDRAACEDHTPGEYLRMSYFEIWYAAMARLLVQKRLISEQELRSGRATRPAMPSSRALRPDAVAQTELAAGSYLRDARRPARFKLAERVRARNIHPVGHTRLPRYLRGHAGEVVAVHGAFVFPDSNACGRGEDARWLYTVRFAASELWGGASKDAVHAELWEPYLEPA